MIQQPCRRRSCRRFRQSLWLACRILLASATISLCLVTLSWHEDSCYPSFCPAALGRQLGKHFLLSPRLPSCFLAHKIPRQRPQTARAWYRCELRHATCNDGKDTRTCTSTQGNHNSWGSRLQPNISSPYQRSWIMFIKLILKKNPAVQNKTFTFHLWILCLLILWVSDP